MVHASSVFLSPWLGFGSNAYFYAGNVLQIKDWQGSNQAGWCGPVRVRIQAVERRGHTEVVGRQESRGSRYSFHECGGPVKHGIKLPWTPNPCSSVELSQTTHALNWYLSIGVTHEFVVGLHGWIFKRPYAALFDFRIRGSTANLLNPLSCYSRFSLVHRPFRGVVSRNVKYNDM